MEKIRVNNVHIAYEDQGVGPALVLLHGYPFNRSMWAEQVIPLSIDYRVITPDLRGHGDSEASDTATMNQMAADVCALMDLLGIRHATIGGLSMGGYVALAFYDLFPNRVENLLLADT